MFDASLIWARKLFQTVTGWLSKLRKSKRFKYAGSLSQSMDVDQGLTRKKTKSPNKEVMANHKSPEKMASLKESDR